MLLLAIAFGAGFFFGTIMATNPAPETTKPNKPAIKPPLRSYTPTSARQRAELGKIKAIDKALKKLNAK